MRQRRKTVMMILVLASYLLSACHEPVVGPEVSGKAVSFTARTGLGSLTKTEYKNTVVNGIELMEWKDKDPIRVASPEAKVYDKNTNPWTYTTNRVSGTTVWSDADYLIVGSTISSSGSISEAKVENPTPTSSGLQWGADVFVGTSGDPYHFYGIYPGQDKKSISFTSVTASQAVIAASLPADQTKSGNSAGAPVTSKPDSLVLPPDMEFAYMRAYAEVPWNGSGSAPDLPLGFYPMITTFQVTVGGDPDNTQDELTLSRVELVSSSCRLIGAWTTTVTGDTRSSVSYDITTPGLVTAGTGANNTAFLNMPANTKIDKDKQLTFTFFVLPKGVAYDVTGQSSKFGVTSLTDQTAITDLSLRFQVSGKFGGTSTVTKWLSLPLKVKEDYTPTASDQLNINGRKYVEFPAGRKINIKNITLPLQLNPWTFSVSATDLEEEISDVAVNPVQVQMWDKVESPETLEELHAKNFTATPIDDCIVSGEEVINDKSRDNTVSVTKTIGNESTPAPWTLYFTDTEPSVGDDLSASWSSSPLPDAQGRNYLSLSAYSGDGYDNPLTITLVGNDFEKTGLTWSAAASDMRTSMSGRNLGTVDLSTMALSSGGKFVSGNSASTANCYVINGCGTFLIPMVYGNGVQKGVAANAYQGITQPSGNTYGPTLPTFVNADGRAITSDYILSDANLTKSGNYSARIVWQDVMKGAEIIEDADVLFCATAPSGAALSCPYIKFEVKPYDSVSDKGIKTGNAVIALYDNTNEKILWSWHIWFTDEVFTPKDVYYTATAKESHLPVSLGWTPMITYNSATPARDQYVVVVCTETRKVVDVFKAGQLTHETAFRQECTNLLYQFGRKDPILYISKNVTVGVDSPVHVNTSSWYTVGATGREINKATPAASTHEERLGWTVQNPHVFLFVGPSDYPNYYNLWNADKASSTDTNVKKSIYDPSPRGFRLPRRDSYNGFTAASGSTVAAVEGTGMPKGMLFSRDYQNPSGVQDFFFPEGSRQANGSYSPSGLGHGQAWTATVHGVSYYTDGYAGSAAYCLNFYSGSVETPPSIYNKGYALPVRPVMDDAENVPANLPSYVVGGNPFE